MAKYLWLAVTPDEFEFPIFIEDTASKLANRLGVTMGTILALEFNKMGGERSGRKIVKVKV